MLRHFLQNINPYQLPIRKKSYASIKKADRKQSDLKLFD